MTTVSPSAEAFPQRHEFHGKCRTRHHWSNYVVSGSGIFLGQSGDPISIGPVSLRTVNQYTGIYALDTFDVTKAFSITAGGRFNDAQDQAGGPDRQRAERL